MHVSHHVTSCHVARELSKHSHYHYHPVCSLAIYCRVCFRFQCHQLSCLCQCTVSLSFIYLFKVTILPRMSCLFTVNTLSSEFCFLLNVTTLSRMFCVMLVMLVNCRHNYNHLCLVFHCQHFRFALSCLFERCHHIVTLVLLAGSCYSVKKIIHVKFEKCQCRRF